MQNNSQQKNKWLPHAAGRRCHPVQCHSTRVRRLPLLRPTFALAPDGCVEIFGRAAQLHIRLLVLARILVGLGLGLGFPALQA